ncbi:carbamoyl phosphate synthase large subunit [Euzebyella marina]|uniref:Carbamoyl phosphate synthase large subunit n=1 Tax=Euzebyella marina TaxID=1761453 RepID=A0A3G2L870_9FLAO|nr:ATP-grasp domain-containing protein [Euzebyella marina]AYN68450.1 carbamoyl phosphate synthase large subunit [Euzebyella marina]
MNILISSAGRRVSLVRAFQKELKKLYPNGKVYASDANPILSGACQIADGYFEVPYLTNDDYFDVLIKECKERDIQLIIPTIDTELLPLAQHRKKLEANGIVPLVASEDFVAKCRDKRQIHKFFESYGVGIAKEYDKSNFELPIFIKPIDGSRSVDTYLIQDRSELTDYHLENPKLMFLEYLDHDTYDEFTCDMYYSKDHKLKCIVPRKRIEVRDGEVYKALAVFNELVPYLKDKLSTVEGAVGCLTAQFFLNSDNNDIRAIEINPRFGGGFPLSYLAGANYPKWIIEEYGKNKEIPDSFECWEKDLLMIRYDDEILVHGYKD